MRVLSKLYLLQMIPLAFWITAPDVNLAQPPSQPPSLFSPARGWTKDPGQNLLKMDRQAFVEINTSLINLEAARNFPQALEHQEYRPFEQSFILKSLTLPMFQDVTFVVDLYDVKLSRDRESITWIGKIRDLKFSEVTLTIRSPELIGTVNPGSGKIYEIRPARGEGNRAIIEQIDTSAFPPDGKPIMPTPRAVALSPQLRANGADSDDGSMIDVMVVYTPSVRASIGGDNAVKAMIDDGIAKTNQGYANSHIIQRVRLVYSTMIQYSEVEGFDVILKNLADPTDGVMDEVPKLRDQYGADLVSLWINSNRSYCGKVYLLTQGDSTFESSAYSVVWVGCAVSVYGFAHEMGHNEGCQHDRGSSYGLTGYFPYSYGYLMPQNEPVNRTIMAEDCIKSSCARVNNWSDPDTGTGRPISDPMAADNSLTLNNTRKIVANFRQTVVH
jgi:peptidyl-Asp metalloendopeptidase